jgi:hypothetical protein
MTDCAFRFDDNKYYENERPSSFERDYLDLQTEIGERKMMHLASSL